MAEHNQQFSSHAEWVNKASSWLTRHPDYSDDFRAICYDAKGRLCRIGRDFHRARDEGTFPVKWIWPDQVAKLLDALTPSAETKAAYIGEFSFTQEVDDGEHGIATEKLYVPWTVVKQILAAIRARAGVRP